MVIVCLVNTTKDCGTNMVTKEEIGFSMDNLLKEVQRAHERLDALQKENEILHELVKHLASRPNPYVPPVQVPNYPEPPWKVTC